MSGRSYRALVSDSRSRSSVSVATVLNVGRGVGGDVSAPGVGDDTEKGAPSGRSGIGVETGVACSPHAPARTAVTANSRAARQTNEPTHSRPALP